MAVKRRRRSQRINFWLTTEEKAELQRLAAETGLEVSAYLRAVALGYRPRSILDRGEVAKLQSANADLARLGTLLNAWLANEGRVREVAASDPEQLRSMLRLTLQEIHARQAELRGVVGRVVHERQEPEGPAL